MKNGARRISAAHEKSLLLIIMGPLARKTRPSWPLRLREGSPLQFRNRHAGYYLLLIVVGIGVVVKSAHRSGVLSGCRGAIPEVIPDESLATADAMRVGRVELRVPGVLGHADVVPDGRERGGIELDGSIDAIIGASVRSSRRGRGAGIKSNPGGGGFHRSRCWTGQTAIVERNTDRVGAAVI